MQALALCIKDSVSAATSAGAGGVKVGTAGIGACACAHVYVCCAVIFCDYVCMSCWFGGAARVVRRPLPCGERFIYLQLTVYVFMYACVYK